jgi:hypothetical protein
VLHKTWVRSAVSMSAEGGGPRRNSLASPRVGWGEKTRAITSVQRAREDREDSRCSPSTATRGASEDWCGPPTVCRRHARGAETCCLQHQALQLPTQRSDPTPPVSGETCGGGGPPHSSTRETSEVGPTCRTPCVSHPMSAATTKQAKRDCSKQHVSAQRAHPPHPPIRARTKTSERSQPTYPTPTTWAGIPCSWARGTRAAPPARARDRGLSASAHRRVRAGTALASR